jgi:hypothetical protein
MLLVFAENKMQNTLEGKKAWCVSILLQQHAVK